jgi:hypothetical protein
MDKTPSIEITSANPSLLSNTTEFPPEIGGIVVVLEGEADPVEEDMENLVALWDAEEEGLAVVTAEVGTGTAVTDPVPVTLIGGETTEIVGSEDAEEYIVVTGTRGAATT